jgi:hypothetical protein
VRTRCHNTQVPPALHTNGSTTITVANTITDDMDCERV